MRTLFQKDASPLSLLLAAVLALGLALAVYQSALPDVSNEDGARRFQSSSVTVAGSRIGAQASSTVLVTDRLVSTDSNAAHSLLPQGIKNIEGEGGLGVHRAVLKNGVWFPVFSPGDALEPDGTAGRATVAEVPLSITSGTPPAGKVGIPFAFDFEAIGGVPPYRWTFRLREAAALFAMDPHTGLLSGLSDSPLRTTLEVFVTDAKGADDSASYPVAIVKESPLAIATILLPEAAIDSAYVARLEAVGGSPPYSWSVSGLEPSGLALTPNTGELSGTPRTAGEFALAVIVTDQQKTAVATTLTFTATGSGPQIVTTELPDATVGSGYSAQFTGEGGATPYTWKLTGSAAAGLSLDAATGVLSGTPTSAGEFKIEAQLTDQEGATATKSLALTIINGLDITTASPLFPASPGLPYNMTFAATGGTPPYQWVLKDGALPFDASGRAWTLSAGGVLSGIAGPAEGVFRFTIELRDAEDRTFSKNFELPQRRGLIAIPSREKAGLAWQPDQIDAALRSSGTALAGFAVARGSAGFPRTPAEGTLVYQGTGSNFVDRNLPVGATFFYTLFLQTVGGSVQPFASAAVTILPMTLQRAQPGVTGDPYADRVTAFQPLTPGGFGADYIPSNITGPPDGKGTFAPASLPTEVASLHARVGAGGSVTVEFTDNIVALDDGPDFTVFENVLFVGGKSTLRFMEPAIVWVALFEGQWYRFPIDVVPPAAGRPLNLMDPFYYNKGFAGRNGTTGSDPTNPAVSGGDSFDANELAVPGLTWIRFIKIQSTGDNAMIDDFGGDPVRHTSASNALSGAGTSGFDLDAVSAVNY